jgi:hypothetical protein
MSSGEAKTSAITTVLLPLGSEKERGKNEMT